ncbi:hypothetical protein KBI23_22040 [bacterium]|nr:hypothetical protein [bacterium]MBP9808268.1 hypothetical protein [bacterium]
MKYTGSITTTGKSEAIRFEKGFFRQNPEFKQQAKVEAHIIGPGKLLVTVIGESEAIDEQDQMVSAFLSFIERDAMRNPENITAVSESVIEQALALTKEVEVSDSDVIDEDVSF